MGNMNRDFFFEKEAACTTSLTTCKAIRFHDMSGMFIQIPAGSAITEFHCYVSGEEEGEYTLAYNENDFAIEKTALTAGRAFRVDPSIFPALWVKVLTNVAAGVLNIFGKS